MANDRVYSRKEIRSILAKASEIQLNEGSEDEDGLTESDLFKIADETGISKHALQQALLNFENDNPNEKFNWFRGTSKIQRLLNINNEFKEEDWEAIVQEIRRITGGIGKTNKIGKTFEWEQRRREIGYKHISITPENGKTKIQYVYNWIGLKINSMHISFMVLFTVSAVYFDSSNLTEFPALALGGIFGIFGLVLNRFYLKSYFNKQKSQVQKLFDAVSNKISKSKEAEISIVESDIFESDATSETVATKKVKS